MVDYVTIDGFTYSNGTSDEGVGIRYLANGGHKDNFIKALTSFLQDAGKAMTTTSVSSVAIGTGSKTFILDADRPFAVGAYVLLADPANPTTKWVYGQVTSYTPSTKTLIVDVQLATGTGTVSSWAVSLAGARGASGAGDVTGPGSSGANAIARYNGTTGKIVKDSGVIVSDLNQISGYVGNNNNQTGTTYTIQASDTGKIIVFNNAGAITVTVPNSLVDGFCCTWHQKGAGKVTFVAGSGATLKNRLSQFSSAGTDATGSLFVRENSGGAAAVAVIAGDTGA